MNEAMGLRAQILEQFASLKVSPLPAASRRVLIVEDDRNDAELLEMTLSRNGFAPEICYTAQDAIRVMSLASPFYVVIVDLDLPGGPGGISVIREMRRFNIHAPVVVVSGHITPEIRAAAMAEGCEVFEKPITDAKVQALLERLHHPVRV